MQILPLNSQQTCSWLIFFYFLYIFLLQSYASVEKDRCVVLLSLVKELIMVTILTSADSFEALLNSYSFMELAILPIY